MAIRAESIVNVRGRERRQKAASTGRWNRTRRNQLMSEFKIHDYVTTQIQVFTVWSLFSNLACNLKTSIFCLKKKLGRDIWALLTALSSQKKITNFIWQIMGGDPSFHILSHIVTELCSAESQRYIAAYLHHHNTCVTAYLHLHPHLFIAIMHIVADKAT